jgi:hypothetical protein
MIDPAGIGWPISVLPLTIRNTEEGVWPKVIKQDKIKINKNPGFIDVEY